VIISDFKCFIDSLNSLSTNPHSVDGTFIKSLKNQMRLSTYFKPVPVEDTLTLSEKLTDLSRLLSKQEYNSDYFDFWKQMISNIQSDYRKRYYPDEFLRDKQMADNVFFWLRRNQTERLALWAASSHLIFGTSNINEKERSDVEKRMGNILQSNLGDQYYFIAFTPYGGKIEFKGYLGLMKRKIKSKNGSLEEILNDNVTQPFGFISFREKTNTEYIQANNIGSANIIWARNVRMNIQGVCDAVFFIKHEKLVRLIDKQ